MISMGQEFGQGLVGMTCLWAVRCLMSIQDGPTHISETLVLAVDCDNLCCFHKDILSICSLIICKVAQASFHEGWLPRE